MRLHTTSAIALATAFIATMTVSHVAFADGMPYKPKKVQAEVPLETAVDEVQNKEPPVAVTTTTTEQTIEQDEPVAAAEPPPVPESRIVEVQPNTSFFGLSVGMYDVTHGQQAVAFNLEYQPGTKIAGVLQPLFGAMATTDGTMMGYGGLGVPFHIGKSVYMMPSVAVGAYKEGAGYDLGQTLAFRVGTEIAYEFENKSRLGLNIHAITNGESLQRKDRTDVISLVYTTPMNAFAGGNADVQ